MLKMGSARQAIELLDAIVADHPRSASALFELGLAHETAGDAEEARWQYEQALALDGEYARALEALEDLR
jgi:Flp pilus assembly protein TadD